MNSFALRKISWAIVPAMIVAIVLTLFFFDPVRVPIYPQCVFHQATGLDCPGCGSLRALHALFHGNVMTALRFNAFLVLSLPLFAWLGFIFIRRKANGEPMPQIKPLWLGLYFAAYALFGILRDLPVPVFAAFAP